MKPRLLDLFCGAGGAAMGYHRAGFDVVGVDIEPQANYPFECLQTDALDVLRAGGVADLLLGDFDAVHSSPPCQSFSAYKNVHKDLPERYPDLIAQTRTLLKNAGLPYVIENVEGSPLRNPVTLCGSMFDPPLDVRRHRLFESNIALQPPMWPCRHKVWGPRFKSATGRKPNSRLTIEIGAWDEKLDVQKRAMGIDWDITLEELSEAIPPTYTEFIGAQLLDAIRFKAAA